MPKKAVAPKKAAAPPGGSADKPGDLVARVREASSMSDMLALIDGAKLQELAAGVISAVLNALATKAAAGDLGDQARDVLRAGEALLKAATAHNAGRPPESAVTVMVRLCCSCGDPQRALSLVDEAQEAGMKPKLRTLAAILAQAADASDQDTCDRVWAKLSVLGLEPQDTEYAAMLRGLRSAPSRQREVLRQMLVELPLPSDPPLVIEIGRAFGTQSVLDLRSAAPPFADGMAEQDGRRWRVGWTSVDVDGLCTLSQRRLRAFGISAQEQDELFACTRKLANESLGFKLFRRWLRSQEPYDVIIDGANVGFNNQNHEGGHFQYNQIDAVVQHFRRVGSRTLLVLHPKWLKEDADLTVMRKKRRKFEQVSKETIAAVDEDEEVDDLDTDVVYPHEGITDAEREAAPETPQHFIRGWKEAGVLVSTPFYDCDDWYWLYAALESFRRGREHVQVVSNDKMRDHHWRMDGAKAFLQWQDRHMTRVSIQCDEVGDLCEPLLIPPRPYSMRAQVSDDGEAWHFPVPAIRSRAEQLQSGRPVANKEIETAEHRWLVAWLDRAPPQPSCNEDADADLALGSRRE